MKVKRRKWTMFTAAAAAAVVFCLLLIPLGLVLLLGGGCQGVSEAPVPESGPDTVKLDLTVSLWRDAEGRIAELDFEEYVAGVVAGEMPSVFEPEALKAQAVAARTYALARIQKAKQGGNPAEHPEAPLCDTTHCQVYRSLPELEKLKGRDWVDHDWPKIAGAAEATAGLAMYYQGALVEQPLFHSASGGQTENSEDVFVSAVPYLRSVSSDYEGEAPYQAETVTLSLDKFKSKIKTACGNPGKISSDSVRILERSAGGRVSQLQVGNLTLTGRQVREALGLRSADFTLSVNGDQITFTTKGYGHGVGMSQWGANGMAQAGFTYEDILGHYYSGIEVSSVRSDLL